MRIATWNVNNGDFVAKLFRLVEHFLGFPFSAGSPSTQDEKVLSLLNPYRHQSLFAAPLFGPVQRPD